jgi:hypothetical protein
MADLGEQFDANAVQPASFDVLPAGEYDAAIVASSMETTSKGLGKYLKLELQILNGPSQNRKVFDNLNLVNPNAKAVEIARGTLSAICRAVGVLTPKDSSELHDKPLRIKLKVTKSEEYGEQNKITSYKPRNAGPVFPAPSAAPSAAAPVQQPTQGQPQPVAAPAGNPW